MHVYKIMLRTNRVFNIRHEMREVICIRMIGDHIPSHTDKNLSFSPYQEKHLLLTLFVILFQPPFVSTLFCQVSSPTLPSMRDRDDMYVAPATEEASLYDQYQFYGIALISRHNIRSVPTIISSEDKSENNQEDLKLTRVNVAVLFFTFYMK